MSEIGKELALRRELAKRGAELGEAVLLAIKRFVEMHGKEEAIQEVIAFDKKYGVDWWGHLPEKIEDESVLDVLADVDVKYLTGDEPRPPGWNRRMGYTKDSVAGNTQKR